MDAVGAGRYRSTWSSPDILGYQPDPMGRALGMTAIGAILPPRHFRVGFPEAGVSVSICLR
jgi:hypothetical protein